MNRKQLMKWIRRNDWIYSEVNLDILSDNELLFLKREIQYRQRMAEA